MKENFELFVGAIICISVFSLFTLPILAAIWLVRHM